ncbi:putative Signal peptide protein [Azospirillaceae bacterium]
MKTWATALLTGACVFGLLAMGTPAWAEDDEAPPAQEKPSAPAEQDIPGAPRAKETALGGFQFSDPPFILPNNGEHITVVRTIAKDLGRTCGVIEGYGWSLKPDDQERLDAMNAKLMNVFRQTGRTVREVKVKSVQNSDVLVYTADSAARKMTVLWALSASGQGVMLIMCDNGGGGKSKNK